MPVIPIDLSCVRYILLKVVWLRATIKVALQGVLFNLPERDKGPSSVHWRRSHSTLPRRRLHFSVSVPTFNNGPSLS